MIVSTQNDRLRLVTQNDHAHFAAELLSLWITDGLPEHPRRRELLFAAREHDNGWREADSAPFCDLEKGRPHDFMSLPEPQRREIWCRGVDRFAVREPWAALLILRHAQNLHRSRNDDPDWQDLLGEWRELRDEWLDGATAEEAELDDDALDADYAWIDLSDLISLTVCCGWREPVARHGFEARLEPGEASDGEFDVLRLDPFPLAGVTSFSLPCRFIPDRAYASDADLAVELAVARWRELALRVMPA